MPQTRLSEHLLASAKILALQTASELRSLASQLNRTATHISEAVHDGSRPDVMFVDIIPNASNIQRLWGRTEAAYDAVRSARLFKDEMLDAPPVTASDILRREG